MSVSDEIPVSAKSEFSSAEVDNILKEFEGKKADLEKVAATKKVIVSIPPKLANRLVSMPFNLLSKFDWPGWKLTDEEAKELETAWKPLMDQYLPAWFVKWFPLLLAVATTLEVVGRKVQQRGEWAAKREGKTPSKLAPPSQSTVAPPVIEPVPGPVPLPEPVRQELPSSITPKVKEIPVLPKRKASQKEMKIQSDAAQAQQTSNAMLDKLKQLGGMHNGKNSVKRDWHDKVSES